MCLAQGHMAVMQARLEPAAPQSRVKHSSTDLPIIICNRWTMIMGDRWTISMGDRWTMTMGNR